MAVQRDKIIANAEKLVAKGKIEPAIKEYEHLLDDNPNDVNTLNRIGDLWVRINRTDEAVKTFGKIADHYSKDGFFLKAIAIYKKINKLDPSKLDVYAKLADLYAKQGLAMEAKSQYQVLADYYLKHGEAGNALNIYRKIAELDPNAIQVHVKLADLYLQNNQTGEALKEYDRVGRALLKRGMLDEAVQVFKKALKIDAKNVELVESLVSALLDAKDLNNAQAIVETALASNQNNPRLLASWSRILIAKGDVASAKSGLEKAIAADPSEPAPREALADLYLRQGNADKALEMLGPVADRALQRGERSAAVEAMNKVLRIDQSHTPTLEKLVGLYSRLNEETNILASMNSLAEAHIANGRYEQAAGVLDKLIQREPQNAQHRTKLQFVKSQMGGVDTLPHSRPESAPPPMELEEVPPAMEFDDSPGTSFDLDTSPSADLDFGGMSEPAAPPPRIGEDDEAAPALEIDHGGDDLDFITEHLTEAEVFAKYGLAEKATEHLRAVIDRAPRHLPAYEKLYKILLDEGEIDAARDAAAQFIALLQEQQDSAAIDAVKEEFMSRGQALPVPSGEPALAFEPSIEEVEAELPLPEIETELPSIEEELPSIEESLSFEEELPSIEAELPSIEEEPEVETEAEAESMAVETDLSFDMSEEEPALSFDETPAVEEAQPFFGTESTGSVAPEAELEIETEPVTPATPSVEDLGEIDFFIEQEMFDDARTKLDTLQDEFPGSNDLLKRRKRLDAAVAAAEAIAEAAKKAAARHAARTAAAAPPPPPPPPVIEPEPEVQPEPEPESETLFADDSSELLSALGDDDFIPTPPPPAVEEAAPAAPPPALSSVQEENLFADEDDFFDLASELESELAEESEQISLSEEEQSLEEIFKEFKKGVEQQLDSEDYDTHYNLGIAYKEMGLIDEAIGEFQLASKDAKRAVECASMLGLCFLEKGMPQLAIKWYRKGLEMPEITEEEHLGLLYDLGSAYMEVGDSDNAQKAFMEVYAMNTGYRDIATRIKQLEDARK